MMLDLQERWPGAARVVEEPRSGVDQPTGSGPGPISPLTPAERFRDLLRGQPQSGLPATWLRTPVIPVGRHSVRFSTRLLPSSVMAACHVLRVRLIYEGHGVDFLVVRLEYCE